MAQKITLSIPDLLHEKLNEWRSSFNLSKMFQEAVTEAIQKKEEFQKRFSQECDMTEVISRLKKEKQDWEKKFYKLGKSEGFSWASSAHYEDLIYVLHYDGTYQLTSDPRMEHYFKQIYKSSELAKHHNSETILHEKMFIEGWFEGVEELWKQVKEKI